MAYTVMAAKHGVCDYCLLLAAMEVKYLMNKSRHMTTDRAERQRLLYETEYETMTYRHVLN